MFRIGSNIAHECLGGYAVKLLTPFFNCTLLAALEGSELNTKRFEYSELRVATRNFSPSMKLGAGAFGAVYKV